MLDVEISFIRKAKAHVDQFPKDIKFIASFIIDSQNNQDYIINSANINLITGEYFFLSL